MHTFDKFIVRFIICWTKVIQPHKLMYHGCNLLKYNYIVHSINQPMNHFHSLLSSFNTLSARSLSAKEKNRWSSVMSSDDARCRLQSFFVCLHFSCISNQPNAGTSSLSSFVVGCSNLQLIPIDQPHHHLSCPSWQLNQHYQLSVFTDGHGNILHCRLVHSLVLIQEWYSTDAKYFSY